MQRDFIVTVTTDDGTLLGRNQTNGGLLGLCSVLLRLFNLSWSLFTDTDEYMIERGSGTQLSASPSPSPTES